MHSSHILFNETVVLSLLTLACVTAPPGALRADEPRNWSSQDKKFTVSAIIVSATSSEVVLERADNGRRIKVPLAKLSKDDQQFVKDYLAKRTTPGDNDSLVAVPALPILQLKPIDGDDYELAPIGLLHKPMPGYEWREIDQSGKRAFQASNASASATFTLTILPTAIDNAARQKLIESDWQATSKTHAANGEIRKVLLPFPQPRYEYLQSLSFEIDSDNKPQLHVITYGFMGGVTLRVEYVGSSLVTGRDGAQSAIKDLTSPRQPNEQLVALPSYLRPEIEERLQLLRRLAGNNEYHELLVEFLRGSEFSQFQSASELEQKQQVAEFAKRNGAALKRVGDQLSLETARYHASTDSVAFFIGKQPVLTLARDNGRWCIRYPKVFDRPPESFELEDASQTNTKTPDTEPSSTSGKGDMKSVPDGPLLSLSKLDDETVMFSPFGKVPIAESTLQWELASEAPPRLQAQNIQTPAGSSKPIVEDSLRLEILPHIAPTDRKDFVVKRNEQLKDELNQVRKLQLIESTADNVQQVESSYNMTLTGVQRRTVAGTYGTYLFLDDKTIIVEATSWVQENATGRATTLAQHIMKAIQREWR